MAFHTLKIGDKAPEVINTVIEIPRGSHHKYEYDEELDEIKLDRVLHTAVFYPTDYGFIPDTRSEDGDHLDVMVIISDPVFTGCILTAKPIGVLDMADENGQDYKIIAVADKDPRVSTLQSIEDMDEHRKKEIVHFFEIYKQLENKQVTVKGWLGKEEAYRLILEAQDKFQKEQH